MPRFTTQELDNAALADLLNDARCSEEQAVSGPFWPDRGITSESLLRYAADCRVKAERYRGGGAHVAVSYASCPFPPQQGEDGPIVDLN